MRTIFSGLFLFLTIAQGSCHYGVRDIASVPDNPSYTQDVAPLLNDHCVVCHGWPPDRGAPPKFRADVYDDTNGVPGVHSYASTINYYVQKDMMPPGGVAASDGVGPNGKAMLQKWTDGCQASDCNY
jgi:hypothetical protein